MLISFAAVVVGDFTESMCFYWASQLPDVFINKKLRVH